MSKRSKRMLSLLLGAGLVLSTPRRWPGAGINTKRAPITGFESYSPGYGSAGYGYQPAYPQIYRRAYRPYYYGYRPQYRWPGYGYYPNFPGYRYYRRHGTSARDAKILVCLFSMIFIYCCLDVVGR